MYNFGQSYLLAGRLTDYTLILLTIIESSNSRFHHVELAMYMQLYDLPVSVSTLSAFVRSPFRIITILLLTAALITAVIVTSVLLTRKSSGKLQ